MAVISFKCPNCDGELIFDPETQKYKCEYCGSKFTQAELDALQPAESEETDAGAADGSDEAEQETTEQRECGHKEKEGEDGGAEAVIYNCPSCGAEIVTDATTKSHVLLLLSQSGRAWKTAGRKVSSKQSHSL